MNDRNYCARRDDCLEPLLLFFEVEHTFLPLEDWLTSAGIYRVHYTSDPTTASCAGGVLFLSPRDCESLGWELEMSDLRLRSPSSPFTLEEVPVDSSSSRLS